MITPLPLPAEPATTSGEKFVTSETKPYVLFMRTDVAVEQNKKLYPIKDVSGRAFIVSKNGQKVEVPMVGEPHKIEFQYALTLARATASLTDLKSERTYSPGTDPRMVRQREAALTNAVMGDNASLAEGKFIGTSQGGLIGYGGRYAGALQPRGTVGGPGGEKPRTSAESSGPTSGGPRDPWDIQADGAFATQIQAESMMSSELGQAASGRLRAESDLAKQLFDAVAVSFEFSSQVYLEKPYVVVITRFHAPDDKPGTARSGVFAKALEAIGSRPTRIEVLHGGFPPGFEIDDLQVHLYSDGREIPTDIAQKRVPLTRDDAFEYLKIEYDNTHKGQTLVAMPALGRPDKEERLRLTPNQLKATYYVKVDKAGHPLGTFFDEECTQPVDDTIGALARNVRYYPALDQGKPVEGIARLSWSQLEL